MAVYLFYLFFFLKDTSAWKNLCRASKVGHDLFVNRKEIQKETFVKSVYKLTIIIQIVRYLLVLFFLMAPRIEFSSPFKSSDAIALSQTILINKCQILIYDI